MKVLVVEYLSDLNSGLKILKLLSQKKHQNINGQPLNYTVEMTEITAEDRRLSRLEILGSSAEPNYHIQVFRDIE